MSPPQTTDITYYNKSDSVTFATDVNVVGNFSVKKNPIKKHKSRKSKPAEDKTIFEVQQSVDKLVNNHNHNSTLTFTNIDTIFSISSETANPSHDICKFSSKYPTNNYTNNNGQLAITQPITAPPDKCIPQIHTLAHNIDIYDEVITLKEILKYDNTDPLATIYINAWSVETLSRIFIRNDVNPNGFYLGYIYTHNTPLLPPENVLKAKSYAPSPLSTEYSTNTQWYELYDNNWYITIYDPMVNYSKRILVGSYQQPSDCLCFCSCTNHIQIA